MAEISSQDSGFKGLRVVSFESRRSEQMADLIARNGGQALVAPSMREIPLEENHEALAFGRKLLAGEIHAVIFLTGVGTRALFQVLETQTPRDRLLHAFSKIPLMARGPKPVTALRDLGLTPT